ncbi:WbqC family protein [Agrobacterium sp. CG674]
MRVVISQSMYFPWVGFLEQIRLADVFVHYDDVQFSKGSFTNRVQIKTDADSVWMSVPLKDLHLGQSINEVKPAPTPLWREKHLNLLRRSFKGAPFKEDAVGLAESVLKFDHEHLGSLGRASTKALTDYFGIGKNCKFIDVESLKVSGSGSQRVHDIVKAVGGTDYVTGHGASNYLDHRLLESSGISVSYMDYKKTPYPQLNGDFTPYVSSLDLIANCGKEGICYICSDTVPSRDFLVFGTNGTGTKP